MQKQHKSQAGHGGILRFALLILVTLLLTVGLALLFLPRSGRGGAGGAGAAFVLYLDPGHGGFDHGAGATLDDGTHLLEKDLVLSLALDVADALRARGYTVHLSRRDDSRLTYSTSAAEVYARRDNAAARGADLLLSLHANAYAGEGRAFGPRVYYDPARTGGEADAARFAAAISGETEEMCGRACRTVPDGSYAILADPAVPALLFECGFLSDPAECALLASEDYRARLVRGIVTGIEEIAQG